MSDETPLHDDILDVDPFLRPWIPLSLRAWLLPPLVLIALAIGVLVATLGYDTSHSVRHVNDGWPIGAGAALVAGLVVLPFGWRAWVEVTERAVLRYRRAVIVTCAVLGVILLVAGVVTRNVLLASVIVNTTLPLLARLRRRLLRRAEVDPRGARRVVALVILIAVVVILLVVANTLLWQGGSTSAYVFGYGVVYGTVTIVGGAITRHQIGRLPAAGD